MNDQPPKRGRPKSAKKLDSATTNYQALAWQAEERRRESQKRGEKMKIANAVKQVMTEAVESWNTDLPEMKAQAAILNPGSEIKLGPVGEYRVEEKYETALRAVRGVRNGWKKKSKK